MRLNELANISKVFQKVRGVKRKLQKKTDDVGGSTWKIGEVSSEDEEEEDEEEEELEEVIDQP
jgi:hypothetical protein